MSLRAVAESIWQGDAIVGTVGSAANDHGTYSFLILTNIASESQQCQSNVEATYQTLQSILTWTLTIQKQQPYSLPSAWSAFF
jgi:hypothetical protein